MQDQEPETVTFVPVKFSIEEWDMMENRTEIDVSPAQYIHDLVMRSLRRKARMTKKETNNET